MKNFFYSGLLANDKKKMKEMVERASAQGYEKVASINKKTDLYVEGRAPNAARHEEALSLGIPMMSEGDFQLMVSGIPAGGTFWPGLPAPGASPEAVLPFFNQTDWSQFRVALHGEFLVNYLKEQEAAHGVTIVHQFVSEKLYSWKGAGALKLMHPYSHHETWPYHGISFDGKWLAIASEMDTDHYDEGSNVQIWDVETGRIVNSMWIEGGVGWFGEGQGLAWSPRSWELGLVYNTNGVGVWDPFGREEPRVYAYVTDGQAFPAPFVWYPDGKSIFIQCPLFKNFDTSIFDGDSEKETGYCDDKSNGCSIAVYQRVGNVGSSANVARKDAIPAAEAPPAGSARITVEQTETGCIYTVNDVRIEVTRNTLTFYRADGEVYGRYIDHKPAQERLKSTGGEDIASENGPDAIFGVSVNGEKVWAVIFDPSFGFNTASLVAPREFDPSQLLNWSLGGRFYWKLDWYGFERFETLEEYYAEKERRKLNAVRR